MSNLIVPAPLWRRLIAAVYDGLLLLGLWMVAALADVLIRDQLLDLPPSRIALQAVFGLVALGFLGYSWTHGGQTLGMRVWRLHVRRLDGSELRWPVAMVRCGALLLVWGISLLPLLLLLPRYADSASMKTAAVIAVLLAAGAAIHQRLDARRRAFCDWMAGTEVVVLPKPPKT